MMNPPPAPPTPKNNGCRSVPGYTKFLPGDDCFYQYEIQDKHDKASSNKAYFGHKVLAVSFGGTLQLFGAKGVTYLQDGQQCTPNVPNTECNPAFTGTSWVRLAGTTGGTKVTLSRTVDWKKGDHIVVTPTDYLPSHAEEVILAKDASETGGNMLELEEPGLTVRSPRHDVLSRRHAGKGWPGERSQRSGYRSRGRHARCRGLAHPKHPGGLAG